MPGPLTKVSSNISGGAHTFKFFPSAPGSSIRPQKMTVIRPFSRRTNCATTKTYEFLDNFDIFASGGASGAPPQNFNECWPETVSAVGVGFLSFSVDLSGNRLAVTVAEVRCHWPKKT